MQRMGVTEKDAKYGNNWRRLKVPDVPSGVGIPGVVTEKLCGLDWQKVECRDLYMPQNPKRK